ncbi:tyrosine-type recombinase/integrase [Aminirod propionatiphilus]|uniref:Tyrosine-type recombinase/integrase n=1 Tax=Aminirod propionatiphilus TaxID=3415223 RepID=A0ACD1DY28_9BACT|nr:tyrosine-type recombinase/integrase [Synergistota bacterium]
MALTELMAKQAKPKEKTYSLSDGKGLILEVRPSGRKYWIVRYWVGGKEKRKSLGPYPGVSLRAAREANFELRKDIAAGELPNRTGELFNDVVEEWLEKRAKPKFSDSYLRTVLIRLNRYVLPEFGHRNPGDITSGTILALCRRIEEQGLTDTAHRIKQLMGQIFRYGIATDRIDTDPTSALSGALQPHKKRHYATIVDAKSVGELMRNIEAYPQLLTRLALRFSALVFCRPGEIRQAEWTEIDWQSAEWRIPAEKMKMDRPHIVPLAEQAVATLRDVHRHTASGKWVFPSARRDGRPMSENTIRVALRTMGYANDDMTAHGFRGMASTLLNENGWPVDVIERQLAHVDKNTVRAAYNHAEYLPQRRDLMQWWADWLARQTKE